MARCASDVFAKGGDVVGYLTNIILPKGFARFDEIFGGFSQFSGEYNIDLLGGDLSSYNGENIIIVVSMVAKVQKFMPRFGAKCGDELYLTKKIGCAYLGFLDAKNGLFATENAREYLMPSLIKPANFDGVNASMDISDGLIQDARKMANASKLCFEIDYNLLPFSAANALQHKEMLAFGDDYNVLVSSSKNVENAVKIGVVKNGVGLELTNFPFEISQAGYDHFA